ncbi:undecaprenyl/decaprenyl-phosphate alpha-N-acetylglucosaminyl 1-phosphate transferase [Patescibacteria group bacterium]|nr:undecaprenyl/decaprenyl-phosphate alpha-N-acetylglucosaminyl 1-phosphate transferase [Patescibacteria group bacterium]
MTLYLLIFGIAVILSFLLTLAVRKIALFFKIQDTPDDMRKKHKKPIPLLGGIAPFLAFFVISLGLYFFDLLPKELGIKIVWLFFASLFIMIGGFLDDRYFFSPKFQIIFPVTAIMIVLWGGIRIGFITNPLGGIVYLSGTVGLVLGFIWLFTMSYTTKILDGLDGLVSGIIVMGGLAIFLFSTLTNFKETGLSYLALILVGVFIGFLFLNFYPARIFLGEGGSIWAGFILGALAILTGAKIAITLLVLALPVIDLVAVIFRRAFIEKKSIFTGDRLHLHFILIDKGWSSRQVLFLYWSVAAVMGIVSIFLPSLSKIIVLVAILFVYFWTELFFFREK